MYHEINLLLQWNVPWYDFTMERTIVQNVMSNRLQWNMLLYKMKGQVNINIHNVHTRCSESINTTKMF